ncbi:lipopolysaccharide biosynthesis protein [Pseudoalteromonas sp. JB197]|uniref:lipopolysaccharide biosynthesis protein n=1 Tax=Pseudoalteromonas sp. JB197 TaxID=1434839 RepID=UPI00097EEE82|nr:oligosaccharide flippase family protein [Pseudoalteromonas sp. JB197]PCC11829.1 polysaccharide biosynthesis protein [Pseudoalteromonas sp. JB197]SJN46483.1 Lipopolysaccharide biosynthesis protein [Pseudoalteromonas sp. JB197]
MTPKKIAAFALGPLAGALLSFITLPIITWLFSQQDIGRLAMLNVVISFSTLLFSLGLDQAYVREFHETKNKPGLFKTVILPGLLLLLLTLSALLSANNVISIWLFDIDSQFLSLLVALVILASFISRFLSLILRMNEKGIAFSMSQVLPKLLLILIIGSYVVLSVNNTITNLLLANVAAILFVCIIYTFNTRKEWLSAISEKVDYAYLKKLLSFGAPLIFGGLAFWGLTATDKILLKELSDFEQLGLYSVAVSFAASATIFQSVFSTVWAPTVYKWAAQGEHFDKIIKVNRFVLLAVIILFSLSGLFSWLITFILPSSYDSVQWILISCLGYPLLYTLSETTVVGIGVTRRSGFAMLAACIAFIINLLGNGWLIPIYGAAGAAVSTCVAFWVFFIMRTEFAIYVWQPIPRRTMYVYSTVLVLGAVANSLYAQEFSAQFILFWVVILLSTLLFFRNEFAQIKNYILRKTV